MDGPILDGDAQRAALMALAEARGESLAALSRVLGRNPAYLQQYVMRGSPRRLAEADRRRLARYLGVPESALGGPEPAALVEVARLDIGASAGPGRTHDREARRRPGELSPALLRELGVRREAASMIRVEGESMAPTLADGDEILVDRDRRDLGPRGGVFVIRLDGALMVKRLRPAIGGVEVTSDNPSADPIGFRRGDGLEVIGRVVWMSRSL